MKDKFLLFLDHMMRKQEQEEMICSFPQEKVIFFLMKQSSLCLFSLACFIIPRRSLSVEADKE